MPVSISTIAKHKGSKVDINHQIMLIRMYEMAVWVYEIVRIIMFSHTNTLELSYEELIFANNIVHLYSTYQTLLCHQWTINIRQGIRSSCKNMPKDLE